MAKQRVGLAGLIPVHFETISLSDSTAIGISGTARTAGAQVFHVSVETAAARYRADSTAPTLATGVLLTTTSSPYWFHGFNGTSLLKFQRTTGTVKLNVQSYKHD